MQLQRSFGVKVTFRQVMEEYPSMASLIAMLEASAAPAAARDSGCRARRATRTIDQ